MEDRSLTEISLETANNRFPIAPFVVVFLLLMWSFQIPFSLYEDEAGDIITPCHNLLATPIQYAPIYRGAYCVFKTILPDISMTFIAKQILLIVLNIALIFAILVSFNVSKRVSTLLSLWMALILIEPNSSSEFAFALALIACLCVARYRQRGWLAFFPILTIAFLVRTEYIIGIISALTLLFLQWRANRNTNARVPIHSFVMGALCFAFCLGLYLFGPQADGAERFQIAFEQHFAYNYHQANRLTGDPWAEPMRFFSMEFPHSQSVGEAIRENPRMVFWHVSFNLFWRLPGQLIARVVPFAIETGSPIQRVLLGAPILITLFGLAALALLKGDWRDDRLLAPAALVALPSVSLVILPWARHLLPLLPLLLILAGKGIEHFTGLPYRWVRPLLAVLNAGLYIMIVAVSIVLIHGASTVAPSASALLQLAREESAHKELRILTSLEFAGERICTLVEDQVCHVMTWDATEKPSDAMHRFKPNWILVGPDWAQHSRIGSDPVMQALIRSPAEFGCVAHQKTREGFELLRCQSSAASPREEGRPTESKARP
jgi:hypothetical protein